jgi:hypothetical protein
MAAKTWIFLPDPRMLFAVAILASLDARLALVLYGLLLVTAAAPIAQAWLRLLPSEREPFARPDAERSKPEHDAFAIFLLANISLSLLLRIPGVDVSWLSRWITSLLPQEGAVHAPMIGFIWFGFIPGLAAAYSAVRANPIRVQLLVGGVLTLALWLGGPYLWAAIAGSP